MTRAEREACAVMAALLAAQRTLADFGLLITVVVSALVMAIALGSAIESDIQPLTSVAALALVLGLVERYFAFRIRLDEKLFDALANGAFDSVASLDVALLQFGLLGKGRSERPLQYRLLGAAALCTRHRTLVVGQWSTVVALAVMQVF